MTAATLLATLTAKGVHLEVRPGGRLRYAGPPDVLGPEVVEAIRRSKPELIASLQARPKVATLPEDGHTTHEDGQETALGQVGHLRAVVSLSEARQRLIAAGCLTRKGQGRVVTTRGPGRLLSFVSQHPDHCQVVLDVDQSRAVELPVADVEPEGA